MLITGLPHGNENVFVEGKKASLRHGQVSGREQQ